MKESANGAKFNPDTAPTEAQRKQLEDAIKTFLLKVKTIAIQKVSYHTLDGLHDHAVKTVTEIFKKDLIIPPLWFLWRSSLETHHYPEIVIIQTLFNGHDEKDVAAFMMQQYMKVTKTRFYCMASEAWTVNIPEGGKFPDMPLVHPDRKEVLSLVSEDALGNWKGSVFEIKRDKWKVTLENRTDSSSRNEKGVQTGRFCGLLRKESKE
jgi:hypothetical protein